MSIIKKWFFVLILLFFVFSSFYWILPEYKKCIIYFNIISFFISIIFIFINVLGEKQTSAGKLMYTLGAIGNKFLLSIIAFVGYFYIFKTHNKLEISIAFIIYFCYFVLSYYFLFQLNKTQNKLKP